MMKTLVAGVGYHNMRDLSLGPELTARMMEMNWPAQISVDPDFSFGPIAIVQRFQADPSLCDRLVLFAAISRDRQPGTITAYRWPGKLPSTSEIQARIGEAVTGVVSLDNLLIIGEQFGIWPDDLFVVEVEPADESWGPGFSREIEENMGKIIATVQKVALSGEIGA